MKKIVLGILIVIAFILAFIFWPLKKNNYSPNNNYNEENNQNVLKNEDAFSYENKTKIGGYIIKDYDGKIAVFDINNEEKPSKITSIAVKDLPEADKNFLKEGIFAENEEVLNNILEDYCS